MRSKHHTHGNSAVAAGAVSGVVAYGRCSMVSPGASESVLVVVAGAV